MKRIFNAQIEDVSRGTVDEGNEEHIIDAYVKINVEGLELWCFFPDWIKHFPYWKPFHPYGIGEELIKNIIGKNLRFEFIFLNIPKTETKLSEIYEKRIIPVNPSTRGGANYTIIGKVIDMEQFSAIPGNERLIVDFGVVSKLGSSFEKGKFKIGDFIEAKGRLDAYLVDNDAGGPSK